MIFISADRLNLVNVKICHLGKDENKAGDDREELDFQFDEEIMDFPAAKHNRFSEPVSIEDESDCELSDGEINKLLIITPHRPKKHDG